MHLIVSRDHAQLVDLLKERFAGDPAVRVILDRRRGERRGGACEILTERRKADRRQARYPLIEAVIDL
jgi:hypothetical protein